MSIHIPADAMDRPVKDHYADLSAEEREAEGLPPAEPPAKVEPAPAPVVAPAPAPAPEPVSSPAADRLMEEIASLREDISSAIGTPTREAPGEEVDALLQEALEHEDPVVRQLGERLKKHEERLAQSERNTSSLIIERHEQQLDTEFDVAAKSYTIGGKPLSDAHLTKIEDVMLARPDLARSLSVSDLVRVIFPDAVRADAQGIPPAPPKGAAPGTTPPVATIVDSGTSGGAAAESRKPTPHKDIDSAVLAAGKRFGWVR